MTALYDLRLAAERNGWTLESSSTGRDTFVRTVTLRDSADARRLVKWAREGWDDKPFSERVIVWYTEKGSVSEASLAGPGQQSLLSAKHVGICAKVHHRGDRNKRATVLSWLTESPIRDTMPTI